MDSDKDSITYGVGSLLEGITHPNSLDKSTPPRSVSAGSTHANTLLG